jgi:16S rRNA (cytidine1402-2'-O)-methyltransferase
MPLQLIATPIGHPEDITLRAIEALKSADFVIGEERAEVSKLLKRLGIEGKKTDLLNEHSDERDLQFLLEQCRSQNVALVTDCGTPGFCDPGARLVRSCRDEGIQIQSLPGASSLMMILSLSGTNLTQFVFVGFLPKEKEARAKALRDLKRESRSFILMDTPYRLTRLLGELAQTFPERQGLLGLDLTLPSERVLEAPLKELAQKIGELKAEFILLVS